MGGRKESSRVSREEREVSAYLEVEIYYCIREGWNGRSYRERNLKEEELTLTWI